MFLAAATNVFGGRYEPEGYGVPPIDIRCPSHRHTVFLPACSVFSPAPPHFLFTIPPPAWNLGTVAKAGWRNFSKCRGRPCASPNRRQAVCPCQMDAEYKRRSGVRAGTGPAPTGDTNTVLLLLRNLVRLISPTGQLSSFPPLHSLSLPHKMTDLNRTRNRSVVGHAFYFNTNRHELNMNDSKNKFIEKL
jgi:hypothetical protein